MKCNQVHVLQEVEIASLAAIYGDKWRTGTKNRMYMIDIMADQDDRRNDNVITLKVNQRTLITLT